MSQAVKIAIIRLTKYSSKRSKYMVLRGCKNVRKRGNIKKGALLIVGRSIFRSIRLYATILLLWVKLKC